MPHEAKIAPSILAADFARLGEHVREAEQAGASRIHVDVMDGHFVRNISMGAPIVASLAVDAGANVLVAGSAVFGDREGVTVGMKSLRASLGLVNQ